MTRHARDLHIEFDADEEDVPTIVAGMVALVDRRLQQEMELRRLGSYSVRVERQVREGVKA